MFSDRTPFFGTNIGNGHVNKHKNDYCNSIHRPLSPLLGSLQIYRLVRKNLTIMTALFIIAIAVFIYMIYVLIKPEKF